MKLNTEKSLKFANFGRYSFDMYAGELRYDGLRIPLRPKASQFLRLLIEADGATVPHCELYQAIWDKRVVQRLDGIHQLAKAVRQALDDAEEELIENVPAIGYRFAGELGLQENLENRYRLTGRSAYFCGLFTVPFAFVAYCVLIAAGIVS